MSFRLSEEEYQELKSLCVAQGARSLSDFVRALVDRLMGNLDSGSDVEAKMQRLSRSVEELSREVKRLSRLMEGGAGGGTQTKAGSAAGEL